MPGYAFQVTMTIRNTTNAEQIVSIPRGTILEPDAAHLAFQSAVVSKDYIFRLNPKETRSVIVDAECWNQHLAPPKATPGKLTPLKGNVGNTTNIWGTSSNPSPTTVSTKPTQDSGIFSAFTNANPDFAWRVLLDISTALASSSPSFNRIVSELNTIPSPSTGIDKLNWIVKMPELKPYLSANKIREFFIKQGNPTEAHIEGIRQLVLNVYGHTSHILASRLYEVAMELSDLADDRKIAVTDERRKELTLLVRQKYTSILDSLPLLDEIEWQP